jgi:sigma-B regulation protein RsbU (phosphoserine phosphatase)
MSQNRFADFFETYTRDLKAEDLQRLFTRDTRDAYRFLTRHVDLAQFEGLPWHKRLLARTRLLFLAFTMKLSPARRIVYGGALLFAALGLINLLKSTPHGGGFPDGTGTLVIAFALMNLLALLEVADRLSLKNDLEVAREIQQAMLPSGRFSAPGVETAGFSRPANTVGGDFYDILPLDGGRVAIAVGDVAGKGSPAALLMALLLAMMRTLIDERLEPGELVSRLNVQVSRHAPGTRFITLFYGVFDPATGELTYVNAGHMPPLVLRADNQIERLTDGGIALGMFDHATYSPGRAILQRDDLLAVYSDGITEAENESGGPFDESGLENALRLYGREPIADIGACVLRAVESHTGDARLADDLTVLVLRRTAPVAAAV